MIKNRGGKLTAGLAAAVLAATSVVALGGVANAAETLTIYAPMASPGAQSPYAAVIKLFEAKYPQYDVKLSEGPEAAAYGATLLTQLQAGNGTDVFKVAPGAGQKDSIITLAKAKFLADIASTGAAKINPAALAANFGVGKKVYGVGLELTAGTLMANLTLMQKDGIAGWPSTFSGLLDACKVATAHDHAMFGFALGFPSSINMLGITISADVYGKDPQWAAKRNAGKTSFANDAGWRKMFERVKKMIDAGCFMKGYEGQSSPAYNNEMFTSKKAIYAYLSPGSRGYQVSLDKAHASDSLKIVAFPGDTAKDSRIMADVNYAFAVNAKAKNMKGAMLFAKFAGTPAAQAAFQSVNGGLPMDGKTDKALYSVASTYIKSGKVIPNMLNTWTNSGVGDAFVKGMQGFLLGKYPAGWGLGKMDKAW